MTNIFKNTQSRIWLNYLWIFIFILVIIFLSNTLVKQLKSEEEKRVESLARAYKLLGSDTELSPETLNFLFDFTDKNKSIPLLILDNKGDYVASKNIDSITIENKVELQKTILEFKETYNPIEFNLGKEKQYLYYQNSKLLTQLEYYPYILIALVMMFIIFTLWYFRTIRRTEQSYLWAGLAKETAHQIGTPLSSIMGWLELLKLDPTDSQSLEEIENDVQRLQFITDRFSKIGSEADLHKTNIIQSTQDIVKYLKKRISDKIVIEIVASEEVLWADVNVPLFNWVIENLVKNAVDSLKDKGNIVVNIRKKDHNIIIDVTDNGPGIPANIRKTIFEPGFSTKKRGWGLGLSLAKRIVESYHKGKIFVLKSEPHQKTTFRIQLKSNE